MSSIVIVSAFCGDKIVNQSFEQCDDGLLNSDTPDKCRTNCARPRCGDFVRDSGEQCDDGNTVNGDACTTACTFTTASLAFCGDRVLQAGELCDDGNNRNGDGCSATCLLESPSVGCGNGALNPGEECDDFNQRNGDGCSSFCYLERGVCGDGITQSALGESCDDANTVSGDGCTACQREAPSATSTGSCGDGVLQAERGEQCDDGARNGRSPSACRPSCLLPVCGDAIADFNEVCDDGNRLDGDGCSALCQREPGGAPEQPPYQSSLPVDMPGQLGTYYPPSSTPTGSVRPPYGQVTPTPGTQPGTGPGLVIFLASGAAAGIGLVRRSLRKR